MVANGSYRWRIGGAAVGAILILGFVGVLLASTGPARQATAPGPDDPARPLAEGNRMSLAEATSAFPAPIYRPDNALGSDSSLLDLWVRTIDPPEAYLEYESGLVVLVRPADAGQPTLEFAEAQMKDGVPGTIVNVHGVDAFLVPPTEAGAGSIRLVLGGAIVTAIGDSRDFSVAELRLIADSIVATADRVEAAG